MLVETACSKYLQICENNKNLSNHTLKAYRIDLAQFINFIDKPIKLQEVTKEHIRKYQRLLTSKGCQPNSIKRKLACIRAMFRWYELEEILETNIFHKLQLNLRTIKSLPKNIPTNEIRSLIRHAKSILGLEAKSRYTSQEIGQIIVASKDMNKLTTLISLEIMLCTGIRVGELVNISLDDLDLVDRRVKIFGKGMRERFVFLPDQEICTLIKSYLVSRNITEPGHDKLLVNSRGKPASTQFVRKLIKKAASASSISRKITPHMCRHSAACQLLEAGIDIRYVQRLLGHHSISTTEIYTHVNDKALQEKVVSANVRRRY